MKKVLFVSNILSHIKTFHIPYLKMFYEMGYEVHVLANDSDMGKIPYCDKLFNVPIYRSPYDLRNIKAYNITKKIIKSENYDVIHCHTPMGGILARLAARKERKKGTKVLYTAHGFHFYKGAPLVNWLVYLPVEWMMSHFTDCLITINKEDYEFAQKYLPLAKLKRVDGVGIDIAKFRKYSIIEKNNVRERFGISVDKLVLVCIAELSYRKNQEQAIKSMLYIRETLPNTVLYLVGKGCEKKLIRIANVFGVSEMVEFLGFRKDIPDILGMSDIVLSTSRQEGLPVNLVEAMAAGKPIVATRCRGNIDLIRDGINGILVDVCNARQLAEALIKIASDNHLIEFMCNENIKDVKKYAYGSLIAQMQKIYFLENITKTELVQH